MTTRLLCRWARLLPRCPQATVAPARLQAPTVHSTEPVCPMSSSWLRLSARHLCQGNELAKMEETPIAYEHTELVRLVEKAATPQEVLQLWAEQGGSASDAARCLVQLSLRVMEKGGEGILQDPRCENMLETVNSQVTMTTSLGKQVHLSLEIEAVVDHHCSSLPSCLSPSGVFGMEWNSSSSSACSHYVGSS